MTLLQHHNVVRTQVYLSRAQHRALKRAAKREGVSMTELLRRVLDQYFEGRRGTAAFGKDAVLSFVALGSSGRSDTSERHDEALDEAFDVGAVR
jgi:hypothetical protein